MSIRMAVACALAVFLLSVALIIGIGLSQPARTTISAAPAPSSSDVSQMKRDFLQAPTANQQSESLPPQAAPSEPKNATQNATAQAAPPQPVPVVAQPPPPPPEYYTTRAS